MNDEEAINGLYERYRQSSPAMNERQRRLWAATEAMKLGRGGITIVSKALRMSRNTIRRGIDDLAEGQSALPARVRVRRPGGGRKAR